MTWKTVKEQKKPNITLFYKGEVSDSLYVKLPDGNFMRIANSPSKISLPLTIGEVMNKYHNSFIPIDAGNTIEITIE